MFHRVLLALFVGTTLLTTACGGGSSSGTPPGGFTGTGNDGNDYATDSQGRCTLSGAVSATVPCTAMATWSSGIDVTTIQVGGASDDLMVAMAVNADGKPQTGTFTVGSSEYGGRATIEKGLKMWSTDLATGGSYTITISSLGAPYDQDDLMSDVHGTAHATVPPGSGASGTIELDATF